MPLSPPRNATRWVAALLVLGGAAQFLAAAQTPTPRAFFQARKGSLSAPAPADPTVIRSRAVLIDFDLLSQERPQRVVLNLFDDTAFAARIEPSRRGVWKGTIDGEPQSTITIINRKGFVAGLVEVPDVGTYRIRSSGNGLHLVQEIDQGAVPQCATGEGQGVAGGGGPAAAGEACEDDGTSIDVLVVYTPIARSAAGGTGAIQAEVELAIEIANDGYENSLIDTQLNLVHMVETDYNENGDYFDHLNRLTFMNDGFMDEVHDLREEYNADMVALLVHDGQFCGVAWIMLNLSADFEDRAFSVTTWYCGGQVFAHELGHNMGCAHDRANAGSGLFPFSYGYQEPTGLFRTIMAYNCPGGCPRITHFSNPDVNWNGRPTGVPDTEPDSADNYQTITLSKPVIAQFRCNIPPCQEGRLAVDQYRTAAAFAAVAADLGAGQPDDFAQIIDQQHIVRYRIFTGTSIEGERNV